MRAKKSYGQHFLTNEHYARQIAEALTLTDTYDHALEVGPGQGMLTKYLLERSAAFNLKVAEADRDMVTYLNVHYPQLSNDILEGDFLRLDLEETFAGRPFGLVGNFPYNISSQILIKLLDNYHLIPEMVGMFQKEVADRVIVGHGTKTYGVIGVLVQARYEPSLLLNVSKGNFAPPPKVESAVIRLVRRDKPLIVDANYGLFKHVVKSAFGKRRKMLRNSLKSIFPAEVMAEDELFQRRPEQVSLEDFADLTRRAADLEQHK
ncbi:16S rRNA (adenine(1518)-N(6)/adenine(1519)-N(6))-dimethyltransferase RsmA [Lewinella sp. IMCC34191]|uniref:16S rRNA (adenine(1518)-N(6)/adenine(1519)-N(6))- dimethyltransferase RsmA n=1 Tax=Lewinella sp. IMCC34191 TaxID=2259172 RepID=UPI000E25885F|nr:16S rRNA (adenine(1518)-N(6)/adenine(1519)-N(6))-dimethyltransferase RsmA [Lewinella sp. IMCC34191]